MGRWGDGEMGGGVVWGVWISTPNPSQEENVERWRDRERFGNGAQMEHFFY
ncbi:MAG: hypothetical protein F6K23_19495 [Okeania sp. SIO2C9]|uniref:hypothetical protein n=1 Tax=Okeania sp. SIO2C9 TaxID=2607791 RepID=UPI0013C1992A|nr:hypothetical protein [Okeania sp. SIO2C9]NEQ75029.1 hypothetical protein [Okeania sp. SIO2C9]